jgi:DNA-3-methyladenine glycosylase I
MRERGEDFSGWLWGFVDGRPIQNTPATMADLPAQTPVSVEMSRALKGRGFGFCGPVITYAFMQATGMVNDHVHTCFRCAEVRAMDGQAAPR